MATGEIRCEEAEVVVVGAGIAGLATALALKRVGAERVVVLERAPGLRATGAALVLFPNAWRALAALGVAHKLIPLYPALQNGQTTDITTGATQEVPFGKASSSEGMGVRPVHRKVLLESLSEELPPGTIRFSTNVTSISTRAPINASCGVVLQMEDGTAIRAKVLIGCDGVHSAVAQWLGLSTPVSCSRAAVRGIAVYPDGHGIKHKFQQLLGKSARAGVVPMNDKEIFWFFTNRSNPSDSSASSRLLFPSRGMTHVTPQFTWTCAQHFMKCKHTCISAKA